MSAEEVLNFWFVEIESKAWWTADPKFDERVRREFGDLHRAAAACELFHWRDDPLGRVAEVIVLDQFSRNMFRNAPGAFATDPLALVLAQEAVSWRVDHKIGTNEKMFLYMPFMHSESRQIHERAIELFSAVPELTKNLAFELKHKAIIDRFGRYPHRNKVLGRESTPEEQEFLNLPGSSF